MTLCLLSVDFVPPPALVTVMPSDESCQISPWERGESRQLVQPVPRNSVSTPSASSTFLRYLELLSTHWR